MTRPLSLLLSFFCYPFSLDKCLCSFRHSNGNTCNDGMPAISSLEGEYPQAYLSLAPFLKASNNRRTLCASAESTSLV